MVYDDVSLAYQENLMEMILLIIGTLNLLLTAALAYKYLSLKNQVQKVHMKYFTEIVENDKLFKKEKIVKIQAQLFMNDLPIGQSFTVSENKTEVVNNDEITKWIKAFAAPLARLGIKYLIK